LERIKFLQILRTSSKLVGFIADGMLFSLKKEDNLRLNTKINEM